MAIVTQLLRADEAGRRAAAQLLAQGSLVAIPTETVYGLAADARNPEAVAAIYAAKGRPSTNPLIVHVPDLEAAERYGQFSPVARDLAAQFWPGPLTLVVPLREGAGLAPAVSAGQPSVAIRVPAHPVARALLAESGLPLAAPSANPSGRISPTSPAHVLAGLGGRIAAVLDAGDCAVGLESSIISTLEPEPRLLRAGGLSRERIEGFLGREIAHGPAVIDVSLAQPAPGMLASHYAPRAGLRLEAVSAAPSEIWIGFGPEAAGDAGLNLSPSGDLDEAAQRLFGALHEADARAEARGQSIAIAPIPERGLGVAINDRLRRAAAPRD